MKASGNSIACPPRILIVSFAYWLLFLLALEPGNIMNNGGRLIAEQEFLRILGASLLGACSAPFLLAMVQRYPVEGTAAWRNAAVQAAGCIGIATALVALSCVLADWFLPTERRPFLTALPQELAGNGPLVAFCTTGFVALMHMRIFRRMAEDEESHATVESRYLNSVVVKTRGREWRVDLAQVDWIESQGNYLALHCGPDSHLLRLGLATLEAKLDPARFVRIHRRIIVALDRVCTLAPLGAGDASLHLSNGTKLRLSRTYRPAFLAARSAGANAPRRPEGSLEVAPLQSYTS